MTPELIDLASADAGGAQTLADLARVVPLVPASTTCQDLERMFGRDPQLTSVLLRHPAVADVLGLVQRQSFEAVMSGPFGYGRALYSRHSASEFAQWDALTMRPHTRVVEAASRAITRHPETVDDDVLVTDGDAVGVVPMPVLLAALARSLATRALRDPLTGLANRDAFFGRVEEACRRSATQSGHGAAVVYLDLDGFKSFNDSLGHDGGDDVLRRVAAGLTGSARPGDMVARIGGDEFAVCLETETETETDEDPAALVAAVARRLQLAVHASAPAGARRPELRASIGLALTGEGLVDPDELVRAADLAMYRAKRAGGDRFTGPVVVSSSAEADPLLGTSVGAAAERDEFLLHFQPIVALDDGRVVSVEALVRWQHPELGLLHPGDFLPAVERAGQLADLDAWVVHAACQQFATWQETSSTRLGLNVNISAAGLLSPGIVDQVLEAVAVARLDPAVLRVEVSEDLLAEHIDAVTPVLRQLAAAGVAVTFDDVGAGSISLRHLRTVAADGLKIDRSYVTGMHESARDRAVVQLLIDFAVGTGARITAEGIETEEQRQLLQSMGCVYGQGWLFARAAPLSDLGRLTDRDREHAAGH